MKRSSVFSILFSLAALASLRLHADPERAEEAGAWKVGGEKWSLAVLVPRGESLDKLLGPLVSSGKAPHGYEKKEEKKDRWIPVPFEDLLPGHQREIRHLVSGGAVRDGSATQQFLEIKSVVIEKPSGTGSKDVVFRITGGWSPTASGSQRVDAKVGPASTEALKGISQEGGSLSFGIPADLLVEVLPQQAGGPGGAVGEKSRGAGSAILWALLGVVAGGFLGALVNWKLNSQKERATNAGLADVIASCSAEVAELSRSRGQRNDGGVRKQHEGRGRGPDGRSTREVWPSGSAIQESLLRLQDELSRVPALKSGNQERKGGGRSDSRSLDDDYVRGREPSPSTGSAADAAPVDVRPQVDEFQRQLKGLEQWRNEWNEQLKASVRALQDPVKALQDQKIRESLILAMVERCPEELRVDLGSQHSQVAQLGRLLELLVRAKMSLAGWLEESPAEASLGDLLAKLSDQLSTLSRGLTRKEGQLPLPALIGAAEHMMSTRETLKQSLIDCGELVLGQGKESLKDLSVELNAVARLKGHEEGPLSKWILKLLGEAQQARAAREFSSEIQRTLFLPETHDGALGVFRNEMGTSLSTLRLAIAAVAETYAKVGAEGVPVEVQNYLGLQDGLNRSRDLLTGITQSMNASGRRRGLWEDLEKKLRPIDFVFRAERFLRMWVDPWEPQSRMLTLHLGVLASVLRLVLWREGVWVRNVNLIPSPEEREKLELATSDYTIAGAMGELQQNAWIAGEFRRLTTIVSRPEAECVIDVRELPLIRTNDLIPLRKGKAIGLNPSSWI